MHLIIVSTDIYPPRNRGSTNLTVHGPSTDETDVDPCKGDQTAFIWEGDDPDDVQKITYSEFHNLVSRFANVLKAPIDLMSDDFIMTSFYFFVAH